MIRKTLVTLAAVAATIAVTTPAQASHDPAFIYQPQDTGIIAVVANTTGHVATYRIEVVRFYSDGDRRITWFLQPFRLRPGHLHDVVVPFAEGGTREPTSIEAWVVRPHRGIVGTSGIVDNPNVP